MSIQVQDVIIREVRLGKGSEIPLDMLRVEALPPAYWPLISEFTQPDIADKPESGWRLIQVLTEPGDLSSKLRGVFVRLRWIDDPA